MLSYIQDQILAIILKENSLCSYSKLKPAGVDDDLYNYHLQQLVKNGYLSKTDSQYSLTLHGKSYVLQIDSAGNYHNNDFRLTILCYVIKEDKILLQRRLRQPYNNDIETVAGKILPGESFVEAAKRKLLEETGLVCDNFVFCGAIRKIRRSKDNKLIEDSVYHVCIGSDPHGDLIEKNVFGENFWADKKTALELIQNNITKTDNTAFLIEKAFSQDFSIIYNLELLTLESY